MFWDELTTEDQAALMAAGSRRRYERGAFLFFEGDSPSHVIVLLFGSLKLTRSTVDGRSVLLEFRRRGALIGESGPIGREPRSATAVAMSPVDALIIPAEGFRTLLAERGTVALAVIDSLVERLRQSAARRLEFGTSDAVTRLARRLLELSTGRPIEADGSLVLISALTQQDLAEWIGVSRDAVVLAFRQLRQLELVETGRQQIRILDVEGLRSFAQSSE